MLGWLAAQGEDLPETTSALYGRVLRHERAYWSRTYTKISDGVRAPRNLLARAAVALTITGPRTFAEELDEALDVVRRVPLLTGLPDMAYQVVRTLQECLQPGPGERFTLRPDPVGDHHLLTVLAQDSSLLERLLPDGVSEEQLHHAVFVLNRSGQNDERAASKHLQQLVKQQPQRWQVVMSVAAAVGGPAEQALAEMVQAGNQVVPLDQLSEAVPLTSVGAWRLGLLVDETRLTSLDLTDDLQRQGQVFLDVSVRRHLAGDRAGALAAIDQAVSVCRSRARTYAAPGFTNDLAMVLNNQALLRAEAGDRAGALASVEEAVALRRDLTRANSAAFTPSLAMALSNMALRRSAAGDQAGALVAIDEAVTLYQTLADTDSAAFSPGLAEALTIQAGQRSDVGDRAGALASINQGVSLYRSLAETDPAAFTPKLAMALNQQAASRSSAGDRAGALASADDAVAFYQMLAQTNPALFTADLAGALNNQANQRSHGTELLSAQRDLRNLVVVAWRMPDSDASRTP